MDYEFRLERKISRMVKNTLCLANAVKRKIQERHVKQLCHLEESLQATEDLQNGGAVTIHYTAHKSRLVLQANLCLWI